MFYIFVSIVVIDLLHFISSRRGVVLGTVSAVVMALVFAYVPMATTPEDTAIYYAYYIHPEWTSGFEPGYQLFTTIIRNTGVDYWQFRFIIALFGFSLIFFALTRFKVAWPNFLGLYALIPFLSDAIQLRHFLMASIGFVAVSFLIKPTKRNYIIFSVLVLLAASFQSLGLTLFIILPVRIWGINPKFLRRYVVIVGLVTAACAISPIRNLLATKVILPVVGLLGRSAQISAYITRSRPGKIIIYDLIAQFAIMALIVLAKRFLDQHQLFDDSEEQIAALIRDAILALWLVVPLYFFSYNFDRMLKFAFMLFFVFVELVQQKFKRRHPRSFFAFGGLVTIVVVVYFFGFYTYSTRWDQVLIPILFHNTFF